MSNKSESGEGLGCVAWFVVVLALCFLFDGDPDVWDKLRQKAMQTTVEKCPPPGASAEPK